MRKYILMIWIAIFLALLTGCKVSDNSIKDLPKEDNNIVNNSGKPTHVTDWNPSTYDVVNNFDFVTMTAKDGTVTPTKLTLVFKNSSSSQCVYGEYFVLEKKINEAWYEVPVTIDSDYGFNSIGYNLPSGDNRELEVVWNWLYGSLGSGEYRIIKDILDFRYTGDFDKYYLAAEFTISNKEKKVVDSWDEYDSSEQPLIGAIPGKNIFLYGKKPRGVELVIDGKAHSYDWEYLTPRFILPRMSVSDFDSDGEDELVIILYVGSGTQYSIEELHILKNKGNGLYSDYSLEPCTYISQLKEFVKLELTDENNESSVADRASNDFILGNLISFDFDDNKLYGRFGLEEKKDENQYPLVIGDVYTEVIFKGEDFTLENLRLGL